MWLLGVVNRWWLLKGLPLLRRIPRLRDLPLVRGHFRIQHVDIPSADRERLRNAVNPNTAAFLGPNHPEFGLDWMMDKEISTFVAPHVASWAEHGIVASAPAFWTRNNLISNRGGEAAAEYSVDWALRGRGVLLHPEGTVHWTANKIHPLFHGIAELATEAARRASAATIDRRVFIVPIVWKFRYVGDVSAGMHREMAIIETALGLDRLHGVSVERRFHHLQEGILARQMARFGFDRGNVAGHDFFSRQERFQRHLLDDLESRHTVEWTEVIARRMSRLDRAIKAKARATPCAGLQHDVEKIEEASRLGGFSREVYGTPTLSQEQIFESLKRARSRLLVRGVRNAIHNFLPTPYGPRVAHVRIPEPILVDAARCSGAPDERDAYVTSLIDRTRQAMQDTLDAINREIASDVAPFSRPNPFFTIAKA